MLSIANDEKSILIIGAGPAGMAAAYELARSGRGKSITVVEKNETVGGLALTYSFSEAAGLFLSDNGPHRFFSKNRYLYDLLENLLGADWKKVERHTQQFIEGKFYDYPVNVGQALKNLGFARAMKMGFDYVLAQIIYHVLRKNQKSFTDYVVAQFGRSLGEFNMINYTEKIWGIPAETIHSDWAGQRIRGLNLVSTVLNALEHALHLKTSDKPKSLVDEFYFPKLGTGQIYDTMRQRCEEQGVKFEFNTRPIAIRYRNNLIEEIVLDNQCAQKTVKPDYLIESIPITDFIKLLQPAPDEAVLSSARKLRFRSQVYLFLTLDKERITRNQWIYFPEKNIPFARAAEMKNFSSIMSPPGKTSLFIEFFCFFNDEVWNKSKEELLEMAMPYFEKYNFFSRQEILSSYLLSQKDAYPLYSLDYQENLKVVKQYLDNFTNLFYIGRPGRFRYNNQDHSLEMGILAAQSILSNQRVDLDKVGAEEEYYESGEVPAASK